MKANLYHIFGKKLSVIDLSDLPDTPYILFCNQHVLMRSEYINILPSDQIDVVLLPAGGDGGDPDKFLRSFLSITTFMLAVWMPGAAFMPNFISGSKFLSALTSATISFGGGMLINQLLPLPQPDIKDEIANQSPNATFSINERKNYFKTGEPIPDIYGRMLVYPVHVMQPYQVYEDNEQYVHYLFLIGHGYYDIEAMYFDDTPLVNLQGEFNTIPDIEYQVIEPGDMLSLFSDNIRTNVEVNNMGMPFRTTDNPDNTVGPFPVCNSDEIVSAIHIDITFPNGICKYNQDGTRSGIQIRFSFQYREIDKQGNPLSDTWEEFSTIPESISENTIDPCRYTFRQTVLDARYEVKGSIDADEPDYSYRMNMVWSALKGVKNSRRVYDGVTCFALKIRAKEEIVRIADKFNMVVCRRLRHYNITERQWEGYQPTQSIAAAVLNILCAPYNGNVPVSYVDVERLYNLHSIWEGRGDYYNTILTGQKTLNECLREILRTGRARHFFLGKKITFYRDQPIEHVSCMFTDDNIVTYRIEYVFQTENMGKAIRVTYFDASTWTENVIVCRPDNVPEIGEVIDIKFNGITNAKQAWREGKFEIESSLQRRKKLILNSDMRAYFPLVGERFSFVVSLPSYDSIVSGYVEDSFIEGEFIKIVVSEILALTQTDYYVIFEKEDSGLYPPLPISYLSDCFYIDADSFVEPSYLKNKRYVLTNKLESIQCDFVVQKISQDSENNVKIEAIEYVPVVDTGEFPSDEPGIQFDTFEYNPSNNSDSVLVYTMADVVVKLKYGDFGPPIEVSHHSYDSGPYGSDFGNFGDLLVNQGVEPIRKLAICLEFEGYSKGYQMDFYSNGWLPDGGYIQSYVYSFVSTLYAQNGIFVLEVRTETSGWTVYRFDHANIVRNNYILSTDILPSPIAEWKLKYQYKRAQPIEQSTDYITNYDFMLRVVNQPSEKWRSHYYQEININKVILYTEA